MYAHLIFRFYLCLGFVFLAPVPTSAAALDIPGHATILSGVGVISGWKCEARGDLTIVFNNDGQHLPLLYGSERGDVRNVGACPDADVGFVAVMNWGNLGDGEHTAVAYDDGVEFARSTFTVVTTGEAFRTDLAGECTIQQFPDPGETARFVWNTGTQHLEMVSVQTRSVDRSIVKYLTGPVAEGKSPGLIAAIIDEAGVRAIASAGVRKQDSPEKFTVNDLLRIGSNTKAMTATMLATLVEDGTFIDGWETTISEVFPELVGEIHSGYHRVTLWQLVSHAGGIAREARDWWSHARLEIKAMRYALMKENLASPPVGPIGEYLYSNLGYMVASAMAEKLAGKSWETLMEERLFTPLGMYSAGFGAPNTPNEVDQPWGHYREAGSWVPSQSESTAVRGPSGSVHVSIADWAKFVHLWFPNSVPKILDRDTLNELIIPKSGYYAAGWGVASRSWAADLALNHSGLHGNFKSYLWVAPNRERAYLAVANSYVSVENSASEDDATEQMLDDIIGNLINHTPSR